MDFKTNQFLAVSGLAAGGETAACANCTAMLGDLKPLSLTEASEAVSQPTATHLKRWGISDIDVR